MSTGHQDADLIIIGGGINGVAVAREAALNGLHPHLIEARDLCYGTSAGSTRLIHGGLRYLEYLEFGLVFESLRERELLLRQRPWRVTELELQLAVQEGDPHWIATLRLGLWLYEAMAGRPFGGWAPKDGGKIEIDPEEEEKRRDAAEKNEILELRSMGIRALIKRSPELGGSRK